MKTDKHKKAARVAEVTAFRGIDASQLCGDGSVAADMKNFKILPDGSLATREGFAVLRSFGDEVRGLHVVRRAEEEFLLAVAGTRLVRLSLPDGAIACESSLPSAEGQVIFFEYDGEIYLLDGAELYRYLGGADFTVCRGYAPLYGKNWDPQSTANPIHEPINLFSDKIRVEFKTNRSPTEFYVGVKLASVDMVLEDGRNNLSSYTLSEDGFSLRRSSMLGTNIPVTLYATLDPSYYHDAVIRACTEVVTFDGFATSRILLYGGPRPSELYCSRPVDALSMAAYETIWPDTTALYFPKGGAMTLDSGERVTAVARIGDRLMIANEGRTFITEELATIPDTEVRFPVRMLSQTVGCLGPGGLTVTGGDRPVTVSAGGIYRWQIDPQLDHRPTLTRISGGIEPLLGVADRRRLRLCYVSGTDTLWLFDPEDGEGRVFLYDLTAERWYSYVGIGAARLFEWDGAVGFFGGREICLFDSTRSTDLCSFGEREIAGLYESLRIDLGSREAVKRATRLFVDADLGGGELTVALSDGRLLDEVSFTGGDGPACRTARITPYRVGRLTLTMRATGRSPRRILGFCIHAAT